jgi:hypothetical protein
MSNAARPGILVRELLSGDGPHVGVAEDFVTNTCTGCGRPVPRDGVHHEAGYLCTHCWARVIGVG